MTVSIPEMRGARTVLSLVINDRDLGLFMSQVYAKVVEGREVRLMIKLAVTNLFIMFSPWELIADSAIWCINFSLIQAEMKWSIFFIS